jgi:hypothetical protein
MTFLRHRDNEHKQFMGNARFRIGGMLLARLIQIYTSWQYPGALSE